MFHACPNPDCAVHQAGGLFPEAMPCVLCGTPLAAARIAVDPVSSSGGARTEEEKAIVEGYPYVMALPYSRMLQEPDGRNRLELLGHRGAHLFKGGIYPRAQPLQHGPHPA